MSDTYKAVEVYELGKLRVVERSIPEPGAGQVRIRVEACGICHTDAATVTGTYPGLNLPRVPDELSSVEAAPLLCAGITTYNALRNAGLRGGDLVAVQGIGGLGHLGIQFAPVRKHDRR